MNFEEQTPLTPLRCGKPSTNDQDGAAYTGNKFSPMHWPSPGPSYGGITSPRNFGIHRTPMHGFGSAAIGDGRLSMGQFEFGADGELVLYSAGGRALPPSADRSVRSPGGATRSISNDGLDASKSRLSLLQGDFGGLEEQRQLKTELVCEAGVEDGQLPTNQVDGLTPLPFGGHGSNGQNMLRLSTGGIVRGTDTMKQGAARQLSMTIAPVQAFDERSGTLTDGGRCRYKKVAFGTDIDTAGNNATTAKVPLSPLELPLDPLASQGCAPGVRLTDEEDMSNATPEMRTRKIQSLYDELEAKQEILSYLQNHICLADQQIAKLIRTNVGLWACSAHIASCIGMALDEESHAIEALKLKAEAAEEAKARPNVTGDPLDDVENMATVSNVRQSKRRRSSLGVANLTQSLNPRASKSSKTGTAGRANAVKQALGLSNVAAIAPIDGKQLMELEEIFAKTSRCEFATGEMINHMPLSSNVLKKTGMCPVENHDTMDTPLSQLQDEDLAPDVGGDPKESMLGAHEVSLRLSLSKENSFSFHR